MSFAAKLSSSYVQSAVRHKQTRTQAERKKGGRKTALFVSKQKDRSWSDDYSPFTRPTGIKGRQETFEAKEEDGKKDRYPVE